MDYDPNLYESCPNSYGRNILCPKDMYMNLDCCLQCFLENETSPSRRLRGITGYGIHYFNKSLEEAKNLIEKGREDISRDLNDEEGDLFDIISVFQKKYDELVEALREQEKNYD